MPPVARNNQDDRNTKIENKSVGFNCLIGLNCQECINTHNTGDKSEQKTDFTTDVND